MFYHVLPHVYQSLFPSFYLHIPLSFLECPVGPSNRQISMMISAGILVGFDRDSPFHGLASGNDVHITMENHMFLSGQTRKNFRLGHVQVRKLLVSHYQRINPMKNIEQLPFSYVSPIIFLWISISIH